MSEPHTSEFNGAIFIGASLSEPHTSESNGGFFIYILLLDKCRALWGEPEQAVCQVKSGLLLTYIDSEHTASLVMCTGSYTIRKVVEKLWGVICVKFRRHSVQAQLATMWAQSANMRAQHEGTECQHEGTTSMHNMRAQYEGATCMHNMRAQHACTT